MENIASHFAEQIQKEQMRAPGAYLVVHEATESFYVGSTGNLSQRKRGHMCDLRKDRNKNTSLQDLYNQDSKVKFLFHPTPTRELAYEKEQALLDAYGNSDSCLNVAKNARSSGLGLVRTEKTRERISAVTKGREPPNKGVKMNDEYYQNFLDSRTAVRKKVLINGQEYASVSEAAKALNVTCSCVTKRLNSNTQQFSNYAYLE